MDEQDEYEGEYSAAAINWADIALLAIGAASCAAQAVNAWCHLAGTVFGAHSRYIDERASFKRDAGMTIEAVQRG